MVMISTTDRPITKQVRIQK